MSRFFSEKYSALVPYVPGEQPQNRKYNKLNTNESPFPPSPYALKLGREAAGDCQLYSDPDCRQLRAVASEKLGVGENEIVFVNGSDEILNFAFMAFCDKDHPAVFPNISYGFYPVFSQVNNVPYREIPLRGDLSVNIDDYIGVEGNVFIANPNAPTGIALPLSDIERIVAGNPDRVVVVDEAYVDFGAESAVCLVKKYDNLLVTQTFSKSRSLAGARLGFGIGNEKLIADINTIRFSTNPYNINKVTEKMGIGALCDEDYFRANCETIIKTREYTAEKLKALGFEMTDSKANFLFAKHKEAKGGDIYGELKERGILVRHFGKPLIDDYLRITIGSREQMDAFIAELEKIL